MELNATVNPDDFTQSRQAAVDEQLLVRFMVKPRKDKARSVQEGRPMFTDCEYIEIRIPGSRDSIYRPAREHDKARFHRHYEMFKQRVEAPVEGTPLGEWPLISRSIAEELAFDNIKTVEALASVADSLLGKRGHATLKRKAQDWLALAENDAPLEHLNAELEQRDATIAAQAHTIAQLAERMAAMEQQVLAPAPPAAEFDPAALAAGLANIAPAATPLNELGAGALDVVEPVEETTLVKRRRRRASIPSKE